MEEAATREERYWQLRSFKRQEFDRRNSEVQLEQSLLLPC